MSEVKIISNYHLRETQYFYELSDKDQTIVESQYDWMDKEELDESQFFKYRDSWYSFCDFMSLHNKVYCPNPPDFMVGWDGYLTDSFFSGVLICYPQNDGFNDELIQIATFY